MFILAIDTSCDDTCISIIKIKNQKSSLAIARRDERREQSSLRLAKSKNTNFEILSNVVSSQIKIHAKYGGIVPYLAKREHERNLPIILNKSLRKAGFINSKSKIRNSKQIPNSKFKIQNINLIAVTVGPGLEPCLWQGVNFAKKLAEDFKKSIVPVNHLEAHLLANWLTPINSNTKLFPAVGLIVSGGHTELILIKDIGKYKLLGETRDDAAGECLDKIARILGLGYPGGPSIAQQAEQWKVKILNPKFQINSKSKINLPRPMINQKNYDFSFSGLKTAVLYEFKNRNLELGKQKNYIQEICYEVQQAVIDVLISKTIRAAREYKVKTIMLGGGVAANKELRKQFNLQLKINNLQINFFVPPSKFCTDNAAMVGVAGYFGWLEGKQKSPKKLEANANLQI
ncbi:MAG TPA: tRNA (adenosine(37)-N6)-threonylcarbamoyltransferase complex transferase subunit TsaD [Candidatus Pacearchaeota archaeon]|nr:tRNA (adenosine(37)-N6)-threonylcarbamoyltransferase complex transferase subunit TsaD [Candidatus Pacearchaeota archaeon]HOK94020.1 tRNA (adenosine(37)-N6)-threonylcarbamoyltransferase complex transferase subunit TsaD [Candidatus Pacearchaeota archaeon]HPO75091.1 tRNA (adenosine(37)-N6)-threonylcarbamoyltransferase complex transferase subunit TsaD [Candidatus Pacearchaeota archaeon]